MGEEEVGLAILGRREEASRGREGEGGGEPGGGEPGAGGAKCVLSHMFLL